jgi:hypothetical protein
MAREFETEIEELLYETLAEDAALAMLLGGDETDSRIYLSWRAEGRPRISDAEPGYVVIRFDEAARPQGMGGAVEDRRERYLLSLFSRPEARELRGDVTARFRALFHRKSFITAGFFVYDMSEAAREQKMADDRLMELRYILSVGFLPR